MAAGLKRGAAEAGITDDVTVKVSKTGKSAVPTRKVPKEALQLVTIPDTLGDVFCQGLNDFGQLGVDKRVRKFAFPVEVPNVVKVNAGLMHTLFITKDGELLSCGQNDEGVLGRRGAENEIHAVDKSNFSGPIARAAGGASHSACVDIYGNLYTWGCYRNSAGLFGRTGGAQVVNKDDLLGPDTPKKCTIAGKVKAVASGLHHTVVITTTNKVLTWGSGEAGQLGRLGARASRRNTRAEESQLIPRAVSFPLSREQKKAKVTPVQLACGAYHTMCLMSDGTVFGWGLNNFGQLGIEVDTSDEDEAVDPDQLKNVSHAPILIESLSHLHVVETVCGEQHSLFRTKEGKVYGFGRNSFHQLGQGEPKDSKDLENTFWQPVLIGGALENVEIARIVSNYHICFAIDTNGVAYSWGMGSTKALAAPPDLNEDEEDDIAQPVRMHGGRLNDRKIMDISCGSMHAMTHLLPKPATED